MTNKELRPQEVKEPRTVKMYHVVYCTLIAAAAVSGLVTGWTLHVNQMSQVKAEAASLSESIVKNVQVKAEVAPSK